jgi:hypothetical protein
VTKLSVRRETLLNAATTQDAVREQYARMKAVMIFMLLMLLNLWEASTIVLRVYESWRNGLARKRAVMLFNNM